MTRSMDTKFTYEDCRKFDTILKSEEKNLKGKNFVCNVCGKIFYRKSSLTVHVNSHSGDLKDVKDERQNICNICRKSFTAKKNLLKHLRDVHKNYKEAEQMVVKKLKCPEKVCEFMCRMMRELRDHIEKCHSIKILKDTLQFSSEAEFQKWKKEEETSTVSWFVTGRKKTVLIDGNKKQILCCHRTGHYSPKGFGKYRMRSTGSCKIGVTCPAAMEIREAPDGHVTVVYYKTHLGHMQDVEYLKLSREERADLAEKIEQGFTLDAILEDVKESSDSKSSTKKRIQLLSKRDLYSIMRTANNNTGKKVRKGAERKNKSEKVSEAPEVGVPQQTLGLRNPELGEGNEIQHNFTLYPAQGVIFPPEQPGPATTGNSKAPPNFSQPTGEGVASQIVILSPDIEYTSVAEIILLSPGETAAPQPALLPQKLAFPPTNESAELSIEEKNKINRLNLRRQLKDKIDRIAEFLPKSEFLTPKQFDLINAKLDGVLGIFDKVKMGRHFSRKKAGRRSKSGEGARQQGGEGQQGYEAPVMYTIYNNGHPSTTLL